MAIYLPASAEEQELALDELTPREIVAELDKQRLELRSHVLTLREGELDSRLRDRDRTIEGLQVQLNALTGLLRKEQATREMLSRQITDLCSVPPTRLSRRKSPPSTRHAKKRKTSRPAPIPRRRATSRLAQKRRR